MSRRICVVLLRRSGDRVRRRVITEAVRRRFTSCTTMKIDSEHFRSLFTPEFRVLAATFDKYGHELRIAGGAVRDLLVGGSPEDVDFATTATPDQMKQMFAAEEIRTLNKNGEAHGTVTARINDKENFEVTTLRIDTETDGRHARVHFTTDWQQDANRRDLTINSMFLGLDGTVYDYFGGVDDLTKKRVAFVGEAHKRIKEDYLRILRYFRFYGRIAHAPDDHEADTREAIRTHASGLAGISGERIWNELKKILRGNHVGHIIPTMIDLGLASHIGLPENPTTLQFKSTYQKSKHLDPLPITLLVSLLKNEQEMLRLHERLKLSADERDLGLFLTEHRTREWNPPRTYELLVLKGNRKRVTERVCELFKYRGEEQRLLDFCKWQPPKFPVSGHSLVQRGLRGNKLGIVLSTLTDRWAESDYKMTEEQLLASLEEDSPAKSHT